YCDAPDSPRRRRTQTTLFDLTDGLCRLLAPVLCHTADEAYRELWKVERGSDTTVHLRTFVESFGVTPDAQWPAVMTIRDDALAALEKAKREGIENPLDAGLELPGDGIDHMDPIDLADLMGVSRVTFGSALQVVDLRDEPRCERSWKRDGTVRERADGGMLSDRDAEAVGV
ncbi:MAG: class I tRNA ligase family protein, partial [Phycisphaerales bacterium]|nr:class I tRNA ligase family protein [Phycisphaerales bacterium]